MRKDWERKRIGDFCETSAGGTPLKSHKDYYENGTIPWLRSGEVGQGEIHESENFITEKGLNNSSAKLFPENCVLVAMYGATAGEVGILRFEAATNQAVCAILPNDSILPKYLYSFLVYYKEKLVAKAIGNAQSNLSQTKIKDIEIPVLPLDEQKRIVSILDDAFEAIDKAKVNIERNIENAEELFESKLDNTFTQQGDGWEEKKVGDIAKVKGGKRLPKGKSLVSTPTDYPYIRVSDFNDDGSIDLDNIQYLTKDIYEEIKKYTITDKDLYISIAGTIGKSGIVPSSLNGANLTENACKLVFNENVFNEFVLYFTFSGLFKKQAGLNTRTTAQPKLALKRVKTIKLGIPELEEQKRIVRYLKSLHDKKNELDELYQQKLTSLRELKSSILQQAFSGELSKKKELVA